MIGTKKTIAMFGGAAALAVAVGFGGIGVSSQDTTPATAAHPAASVAPAKGATPGVDVATLTTCISGLDSAYNTGIPFGNHSKESAYNTGIPFGNHSKESNSSTAQDSQTPTTASSAPQDGSAPVAC